MVFSSPVFLFVFLPLVLGLYYIIPSFHVKNALLILASCIFYAFGEPFVVFLMLLSIGCNYLFGLAMKKKCLRKPALIASIIWNLGLLCVYKYAGFIVSALNALPFLEMPVPEIPLPIGISFFTFQAMSYVIDVYRETIPVQKNPFQLTLYITFFAQLIAGPIVKYKDIAEQLAYRPVNFQQTAHGIQRFIFGLAKKILIADVISIPADAAFSLNNSELILPFAWLGAICYTLQIYFDFSGYSDMAIGLGEMFGFTFKENFNYPYAASSMTEFWRRWHISVSTWFKEYLYFPLGGNRKGKIRTVCNKWIVFFFTGLWHGANWTFIVWGLLHGGFLMLEQFQIIPVKKMQSNKILRFFCHIYTIFVTTLCFVIFRSENVTQARYYLKTMFGLHTIESSQFRISMSLCLKELNPLVLTTILVSFFLCMPIKKWISEKMQSASPAIQTVLCGEVSILSLALLGLCMLYLSSGAYSPFIYLNF